MHIRYAAQTDVGIRRAHNEDAFLVNDELGLFIVADGMGGHAGGEMASSLCVAAVEAALGPLMQQHADRLAVRTRVFESPAAELLRDALDNACLAVHRAAQEDPALDGMGTTCLAVLLHQGAAYVGHVGDSRCYVVRGNVMRQVTDDHSLVSEQVRAGLLTPEQARTSRQRNIITRSIGFEPEVLVDVLGVPLEEGDRLLLCSDGLTNMVSDEELCEILRSEPFEEVPTRLVERANAHGGDDNITAVVLWVESIPPEERPLPLTGDAAFGA